MKVKFEGGRQIEAALKDLGKAAARRTADRALRRAAEPIRSRWEDLVPEDKGNLKRSIKTGKAISSFQKRGNRGDVGTTFVGVDESEDARLHIYAEVEEFGNESHPAQPAGRPAWEEKKQEAFDRLKDDLWDEIRKTAERQARKAAKKAAL